VNIRPVNSVNVNASYFLPGAWGGDHSFKIGGYWKGRLQLQLDAYAGLRAARFPTAVSNDCLALSIANPNTPTAWCQAQIARDGLSIYDLKNISLYAQDSFTRAGSTPTSASDTTSTTIRRWRPTSGQPARAGDSAGDQLPGRRSGGQVQQHLAACRTDLRRERRRQDDRQGELRDVLGSVGTGGISGIVNPVSRTSLRYPWTDANGDKFIQANEIDIRNGGRTSWRSRLVTGPEQPGEHAVDQLGRSEHEERSH
jgi:hypothetical protein